MDFLKIALLQIAPCRTQEANLKKGTEYCRRAKSLGADIVLFPEMWSNGYGICERPAGEWMRDAIPADGDFVNTFGKTARELEIAVGITFLEKYGEGARNTLVLFDRFGKKRLTYAKVHTCQGRAYENMLAVATCNYPATVPDCNGHSTVFDGVAYLPGMEGSRDTCILEADEKEGICLAELDLKRLREYRRSEVHGNAYRHPEKYAILSEDKVQEPFVRTDRRR